METLKTYNTESTLAEQMTERLKALKMTKAEAALKMNYSRPALSQYLSGKYASDPTEIEKEIRAFLEQTGEAGSVCGEKRAAAVPGRCSILNPAIMCRPSDCAVPARTVWRWGSLWQDQATERPTP